jgi:hypothetical protein
MKHEMKSLFGWVCIALAVLVFGAGVLGMPLGGLLA